MKTRSNRIYRTGFTAVESMITVAISVFIVAGLLTVFIVCNRYWHQTSLDLAITRQGNQCLEKMVFGYGTNIGLRGAYWVTNRATSTNWRIQSSNYYGEVWYVYDATNKVVIFSNKQENCVIGRGIVASQVSTINGLSISLTSQQSDGRYTSSNALSTFVKLRAPKAE
ncbi:MAG: hypothetical protein WCO42_03050 [bacterium]